MEERVKMIGNWYKIMKKKSSKVIEDYNENMLKNMWKLSYLEKKLLKNDEKLDIKLKKFEKNA